MSIGSTQVNWVNATQLLPIHLGSILKNDLDLLNSVE